MTDVTVTQKGAAQADGNMRPLGEDMPDERQTLPETYQEMTSGAVYLYNVNLIGNVGDTVTLNFTNAKPATKKIKIDGDVNGALGRENRDVKLTVL